MQRSSFFAYQQGNLAAPRDSNEKPWDQDASCHEMLATIEVAKGIEIRLGPNVPFYAFVCCDLVTDLAGALSDRKQLYCAVRPHRSSKASNGHLAVMTFEYTPPGLRAMFAWVGEQKTRKICANASHSWCKLALKDFHLCSMCTIKRAFLGDSADTPAEPCVDQTGQGAEDPPVPLSHEFFSPTPPQDISELQNIWSSSS